MRASDILKDANQETRAATCCFGTENLRSSCSLESALRPAPVQLENRLRRLGVRLVNLQQDSQVSRLVGAACAPANGWNLPLGKHSGRREKTNPLEVPKSLEADIVVEDEDLAEGGWRGSAGTGGATARKLLM